MLRWAALCAELASTHSLDPLAVWAEHTATQTPASDAPNPTGLGGWRYYFRPEDEAAIYPARLLGLEEGETVTVMGTPALKIEVEGGVSIPPQPSLRPTSASHRSKDFFLDSSQKSGRCVAQGPSFTTRLSALLFCQMTADPPVALPWALAGHFPVCTEERCHMLCPVEPGSTTMLRAVVIRTNASRAVGIWGALC